MTGKEFKDLAEDVFVKARDVIKENGSKRKPNATCKSKARIGNERISR